MDIVVPIVILLALILLNRRINRNERRNRKARRKIERARSAPQICSVCDGYGRIPYKGGFRPCYACHMNGVIR